MSPPILYTEEDKKRQEMRIIGKAQCPWCAQEITVLNDRGKDGPTNNHYFQKHCLKNTSTKCNGSEESLSRLGCLWKLK